MRKAVGSHLEAWLGDAAPAAGPGHGCTVNVEVGTAPMAARPPKGGRPVGIHCGQGEEICFLLFAVLYVASYFIITRYKRKAGKWARAEPPGPAGLGGRVGAAAACTEAADRARPRPDAHWHAKAECELGTGQRGPEAVAAQPPGGGSRLPRGEVTWRLRGRQPRLALPARSAVPRLGAPTTERARDSAPDWAADTAGTSAGAFCPLVISLARPDGTLDIVCGLLVVFSRALGVWKMSAYM
ncbi:hypothetical protein J0S82_020761 [Galemys pyrenaicus]|uniref:Uncharacterized protein n=1 Tax=Galemys pyrenaicus TaxID=202257 RepID=A0A8J6DF41_GALPY|nr:hypothetical protein J0S82_020761 [Galemys pyrenaicus]